MGCARRERIARIEAGLEKSIAQLEKEKNEPSERLMKCEVCGVQVPERRARHHIKDCWGIIVTRFEKIPEHAPPGMAGTKMKH